MPNPFNGIGETTKVIMDASDEGKGVKAVLITVGLALVASGLTAGFMFLNHHLQNKQNKTIFLNFRFGMSEKEVEKHYNLLLKNKKIYLDNNKFTYDFHTSDITLKTKFVPEYFDDQLYKLTLLFEHDIASGAICMFKAIDTFREKALIDGYKMYIYENILGESEYYFINQNIVIKFVDGMMIYTNQPVIESIELEKKKKEESTINDF